MKQRVVFIHGNQAESGWMFAWAPWLKAELDQRGYQTTFETMPDSILARQQYWLSFLQDWLKVNENDVLIGWSTGAIAAMRYAENHKIKGSVLVSPSYTDLDDELEKESGYFDKPWEWTAIKDNQQKIALFYGDDDPYIPQEEFKYIADKLDSETRAVKGGKHFIGQDEFPELLEYMVNAFPANSD